MNTWPLNITYGMVILHRDRADQIVIHTDADSPFSPEVDPERFLKLSFETPKGTGEDYFCANFPFVPYEVVKAYSGERTKFRQDPCDCEPCAVCKGERTICVKCRMCTRCHNHIEGCEGCTGYVP